MSKPAPFVLPEGASLAIGGNSLVIRHAGDIILGQTLGRRLSRVEAQGDLVLTCEPITGVLLADGVLRTEGTVDAQEIRGHEVHIGPGHVKARVIVGRHRVVIGPAKLAVDVVVAPEVSIDPEATGRIRIVDSLGATPASRVRGCLSLEEYEADFGHVAEFLAQRHVTPVNPLPAQDPDESATEMAAESQEETPDVVIVEDALPAQEDSTLDVLPAPDVHVVEDDIQPAAFDTEAPAVAVVTIDAEDEDEDTCIMDEGANTDEEPDGAPDAGPETATPMPKAHPRDDEIRAVVDKIVASYEGPPPEPLQALRALCETSPHAQVEAHLQKIWLDVLRHHVEQQSQPPRAAITQFQTLRGIFDG